MKDPISEKLKSIPVSIFSIMTNMANQYNAINLSQGFPDFPMPKFIKKAACQAIEENHNQYAPSIGIPELRQALSNKYKRFYNFIDSMSILVILSEIFFLRLCSEFKMRS